eukprot:COSAG01_NODE_949_length_12505_cov_3.853539_3_plen_78_part_00
MQQGLGEFLTKGFPSSIRRSTKPSMISRCVLVSPVPLASQPASVPCDHTSMRWAGFADSLCYLEAMATKAASGVLWS